MTPSTITPAVIASNTVVHDSTPNGGVSGWVSLAAHITGSVISDVLQPGVLRLFGKTQGSCSEVVKVLSMSRQRQMCQLALRVRVV
ncbi:hypothetical protein TNCV_2303991 [Trichonephila clavipes]|nr:hypothetical protein TNCV_2303991 [Trichonephila clavipes]